jgi:dTDP-glucose 4,6-dehydratase
MVLRHGQLGGTYNIGGENQPTNLEIVKHVCSILDARYPDALHIPHETLITFVPDRPGHDNRYAMSIGRIKRELQWQPQETLESGLVKTLDWYLEHPEWVRAIDERPSFREWMERNYAGRGELQ